MTKSELCAIQDNLKIEKIKARGGIEVNLYCIPCDKCGRIVKKQIYDSDKIYLCEHCKKQIKKKRKLLEEEALNAVRTKKEQAFDKAVNKIKTQVKNFNQYEKAISLAETRAELYGSIPEAMVAIELLRLGHRVIPQQKIGPYRVDFVLKDSKIVLEIDGKIFHQKKFGGNREAQIQLALGMDWEIIHIPAELIERDIQKLKKCIDSICNIRGKKL